MRRGTDILIALGGEEALARDGLGVVRIAQLVGHEKSQVSRALTALAASGLVDRDPQSRAYRLGWRLFALAARSGRPRLISLAPSTLRRLVAAYGETVHLSVLDGRQVLTLLSEGPSTAIKATGWSGRTVPVTCTSSGRALLLDHDRPGLEAIVDPASFAGLGPNAPRDADELHRRICAAREPGYVLVDEEFEPGLVGVAAPVRDFSGQIMAVLNLSGPKFRLDERLASAGEDLRRAADALSHAMSAQLP